MNWLWIIALVLITFVPSLAARKKVAQAAANDMQDAYGDSGESDDQEDVFFNFGDTEAEEVAPEPKPYFTYEAPQAEVNHVDQVVVAPVEESAAPAFDLRRAIIYQTVLTNKYTSNEN